MAAAGIAGCAVDNELSAARDSWRGATYEQVVAAWGPPAQSTKDSRTDSHTWSTEDRPSAPMQRSGEGAGSVLFSAERTGAKCDRTLAFREGRVREATWSGDPAFCKRFAQRPR